MVAVALTEASTQAGSQAGRQPGGLCHKQDMLHDGHNAQQASMMGAHHCITLALTGLTAGAPARQADAGAGMWQVLTVS